MEKATVVEVLKDNIQEDGSRVGDQVVLFIDGNRTTKKGRFLEANSPNGLLFGTACKPGLEVITISSVVGQLHVTTVYNVDRSMPIYIL